MESKADGQEFEQTIAGDDFDFDFDEDFESEVRSEYMVMDAMRFDREAGTARCNFEIDEDEDDAFRIPGALAPAKVVVSKGNDLADTNATKKKTKGDR